MTGLPLNDELTRLGATFLREDSTAAKYRFYALAGGPPFRPGLLRSESPGAAAIALEIWSMPKSAMGTFLAGIPAPLAIGSIEISDGSLVKGFLCEGSCIEGAREITDLGSWRVFLAQYMADA